MVRSLFRMFKHIAFAIIAIIASVCIAEVGLRGHRLYQQCQNGGANCALKPTPCPVTFQQLPPLTSVERRSAETGEPITITTNTLGLRGPEVTMPKRSGVYRVVCLGDDATLAADVAEPDTFPTLLQTILVAESDTKIEVINAGIPGYCPLLTLAWAEQRLTGLQPDLVILCCDRSDVADDRRVRPLAQYRDDGTLQAVCHPAAARTQQDWLNTIETEFELASLLSGQLGDILANDGTAAEHSQDEWEAESSSSQTPDDAIHTRQAWEPIAEIRDISRKLSADFVVAYVPSMDGLAKASQAENSDPTLSLAAASEEFGVPFLDVSAEFAPQATPPQFISSTGTLSSTGHRLFAELLSWAIIHRDNSTSDTGSKSPPIQPVAAPAPPTDSTSTAPLPSLSRRRRADR